MEAPTNKNELRNFGLLLGTLFLGMLGLLPLLRHHAPARWPMVVAAVLWAAALAWPASLALPFRWWTRFGNVLGWFNTRLVLSVVFFLMLAPVGLVLRLFGRDSMNRRLEPYLDSYGVPSRRRLPKTMEQPY
jgi:Saxitoxin biosynthesis operon protein SxtJ